MARILWLNWDGGGNLPPSLGIARALTARGHEIAFAGRPEMVPRVVAVGFRAIELTQAYAQLDSYPAGSPLRQLACYLTAPATSAQVKSVVAAEAPDLMLIDGMFPAALAAAPEFGLPTAVICHTFFRRLHQEWREQMGRLIGMREAAGFPPLPGLDELWLACDRIIVTSLAELDTGTGDPPANLRHVGPVIEDESRAQPAALPWPAEDQTPLVLVSFSTVLEQRRPVHFQRSLDALADLPVHVVATLGGIVEPGDLDIPGNAVVLNYAAHGPIMARASLVVTHGGHGTAMRALAHGLPMVLMPALAHDQPGVAAAVEEWGAGRALPAEASVGAIREAATEILGNKSFRAGAARIRALLAPVNGAANAAREIEALTA